MKQLDFNICFPPLLPSLHSVKAHNLDKTLWASLVQILASLIHSCWHLCIHTGRTCPQGYIYIAAKCLTVEFIGFKLFGLGNNPVLLCHVNLKNMYVEIALPWPMKTSVQQPDVLFPTLAMVNIDQMSLQVLYPTLGWKRPSNSANKHLRIHFEEYFYAAYFTAISGYD